MRQNINKEILETFFKQFAKSFKTDCSVYVLGGVTAVMYGWRESTHDIDLKIIPDSEAYKVIQELKESLSVNIELASPDDFIPALPAWQDRSEFIIRHGKVSFFHYDFYSQALSKIERGFERDLFDVQSLFQQKLISPQKLIELFNAIQKDLIKFPAINPASFRASVENFLAEIDADIKSL
jgi:hypothetical protein